MNRCVLYYHNKWTGGGENWLTKEMDLYLLCVCMLRSSVVSGSLRPHGLRVPCSSVHGIFQARTLEWVSFPTSGDLPHIGVGCTSPAWEADSLPLCHLGSPSSYWAPSNIRYCLGLLTYYTFKPYNKSMRSLGPYFTGVETKAQRG